MGHTGKANEEKGTDNLIEENQATVKMPAVDQSTI